MGRLDGGDYHGGRGGDRGGGGLGEIDHKWMAGSGVWRSTGVWKGSVSREGTREKTCVETMRGCSIDTVGGETSRVEVGSTAGGAELALGVGLMIADMDLVIARDNDAQGAGEMESTDGAIADGHAGGAGRGVHAGVHAGVHVGVHYEQPVIGCGGGGGWWLSALDTRHQWLGDTDAVRRAHNPPDATCTACARPPPRAPLFQVHMPSANFSKRNPDPVRPRRSRF